MAEELDEIVGEIGVAIQPGLNIKRSRGIAGSQEFGDRLLEPTLPPVGPVVIGGRAIAVHGALLRDGPVESIDKDAAEAHDSPSRW